MINHALHADYAYNRLSENISDFGQAFMGNLKPIIGPKQDGIYFYLRDNAQQHIDQDKVRKCAWCQVIAQRLFYTFSPWV